MGHEQRSGRRIWLVRHGETTGQSAERYFGSTDIPLSELGRQQVARLKPLLAGRPFRALLHSPLSRARSSAEILLESLDPAPAEVAVEPRLTEVDFGALEGQSAAEIEAERPEWFARWQRGEVEGYPDGDSLAGFAGRVAAGIDGVIERYTDGDLLVVAHRGVIKHLLLHMLDVSWPELRRWSLDLGSLSILVEDGVGGWTLERYNLIG